MAKISFLHQFDIRLKRTNLFFNYLRVCCSTADSCILNFITGIMHCSCCYENEFEWYHFNQ